MKRPLFVLGLALGPLASAVPASADIVLPGPCTFDDQTGVMALAVEELDGTITLRREADALFANGAACGGATVHNTDLIRVFARGGITIDLAGGPFAPGATDEGDGSSEIEIEVDTRDLDVLGSNSHDHLVGGRGPHDCTDSGPFNWFAVNLNGDEAAPDADVFDCDNLFPFTGLSSFVGRAGNDRLVLNGEGVSDDLGGFMTLKGGTGDDTLIPGDGDEILRGDRGFDTLDVSWSEQFTWIFAGTQGPGDPHAGLAHVAIGGEIGEDQIFGLERFLTSDFGNQLFGSDRSEEFIAGDGNDVIWPKGGDNVVAGGDGHDAVSFADAPRGVRLDLGAGVASGAGANELSGIEDVEGSAFDDRVVASEANNVIDLLDGDDEVRGLAGADTIMGGPGGDVIDGGTGIDRLSAGGGDDTVRGGLGNDTLVGNNGDDAIDGGRGKDVLVGGGGADTMSGSVGDDRVLGLAGDDTLKGGLGADRIEGNFDDDLLLGGPGRDIMVGGPGRDLIHGGSDADRVQGGGDPDVVRGGRENDVVAGGFGADTVAGGPGKSDRCLIGATDAFSSCELFGLPD